MGDEVKVNRFSRVEHVETCRIGCESFFVLTQRKQSSGGAEVF